MTSNSDLLDLAFSFVFIIAFYQCLMVYLSIHVFNEEEIIAVLTYFDHIVKTSDSEISTIRRNILSGTLKNALLFSKCFLTCLCSVGVIINIYDLNKTEWASPMLFTIPGIPRDSYFFYPTNIIFQIILYFSSIVMIIFSDAVIMVMIMYFQAQLKAITELLLKLDDEEVDQKATAIIRTVHEEHKEALHKFNDMARSFWHAYFHKLLAIMLYLCFTFFIFQSMNESLILGVMVVVSMVSEVYVLCYFGQMVRNSSEKMSDSLYTIRWYELKVRDQKNLLMLMMRFKYPFKVETFGFGTISVYTFVQICKAAVSYATILYTFFD
ncbi:hypothetical protein DMENIID0001_014350 [Sergentomyia squamirostris]